MDIKTADCGTDYFIPTFDRDLAPANFNPTAATVKQIVFRMPGVTALITRTATAAQRTIEGVAVWGLRYVVVATDVGAWVDANNGGFHYAAGPISMEGYVEFSSAQKWSSGIVTIDQKRRPLQVVARLA